MFETPLGPADWITLTWNGGHGRYIGCVTFEGDILLVHMSGAISPPFQDDPLIWKVHFWLRFRNVSWFFRRHVFEIVHPLTGGYIVMITAPDLGALMLESIQTSQTKTITNIADVAQRIKHAVGNVSGNTPPPLLNHQ